MAGTAAVTHEGTFEPALGGAPPVGAGRLEARADGLRIEGSAERRVLANVIATVLGLAVTFVVVLVAMNVLDALDRIAGGDSLRPAVTAGIVALAGTYWLASRFLPRLLPPRRIEALVPYRYVLSTVAKDGVLHVVLTAPACDGRLAFRTADAPKLLFAIDAQKRAG